jgi:hypothetical protein
MATEEQKKSTWKIWKIRLIILIILFLILEVGFRIGGNTPGLLFKDFKIAPEAKYNAYVYADSLGINHLCPDTSLPQNQQRNSEGFRSTFEFSIRQIDSFRKEGKKIIFLIGDSYTEGCCAENYSNSFADLLNSDSSKIILNFGVAGTDPLQYRLVAEHYTPILNPDLIVVVYYAGNDFLDFIRLPKPDIPLFYHYEGVGFLPSEIAAHHVMGYNHTLKTPEEAYEFYLKKYSLFSSDRNWLQTIAAHSVILSKAFLGFPLFVKRLRWNTIKPSPLSNMPYELLLLDSFCQNQNISLLATLIPTPADVKGNIDLKEKYHSYFKGCEIIFPTSVHFETTDYDGMEIKNHFIESGHAKYAKFLEAEIEKALAAQ